MQKELAASGLSPEEILAKTLLLQVMVMVMVMVISSVTIIIVTLIATIIIIIVRNASLETTHQPSSTRP